MAKQCQHFLKSRKCQHLFTKFAKTSWKTNLSGAPAFRVSCLHTHHVHRQIMSSGSAPNLHQTGLFKCYENKDLRIFSQNLVRWKSQFIKSSTLATSNVAPSLPNWTDKQKPLARTCLVSKTNKWLLAQSICTKHCDSVQTVREAITWWTEKYNACGIPEPEISAKYIIAHAVGFKQLNELTDGILCRILETDEKNVIDDLCRKRLDRMPVQYIIGEWDFRNLTLLIRAPVFIPCSETELLVELVLDHHEASDECHFLEIGCGTGAISISLLTELPKANVTVVEQSKDACMLTEENATRLGVIDRLTIHHGDLGAELPACLHGCHFDAIVSNPPYIATGDLQGVDQEVSRYIDTTALNGGIDGLNVIKNICLLARHVLKPNAFIWLETDTYQADMIDEWLQQHPDTRVTFLNRFNDFTDRPRYCQLQLK